MIWELFSGIEKGWEFSGDEDVAFLAGKTTRASDLTVFLISILSQRFGRRKPGLIVVSILADGVNSKVGARPFIRRHTSDLKGIEWKVDKDSQTDLHRHLSHLVGLFPSYSIASYPEGGALPGITKDSLFRAARRSLIGRGDGKGPDADAGEPSYQP